MKKRTNRPGALKKLLPGLFFGVAVLLTGCKKPDLGLEAQNPEDAVNLNNSSGIILKTTLEKEDSVRSDELNLNLLGTLNDSLLGKVSAGFYAQFRLPAPNINFGNLPVADSIILSLPYNGGAYGNIYSKQKIFVYRLNQNFYKDSAYFSNDSLILYPNPIGQTDFISPMINDSVKVFDVISKKTYKSRPQLRIPLENELAKEFLNNQDKFTSNETFLDFFKGLYIRSETETNSEGSGAILDFRLTSGAAIEFYYHNASDTFMVSIKVNENCARFNRFSRIYSPEIMNALTNSTVNGLQTTYVATMAGLRTRIDLPNIIKWRDSVLSINKGAFILINKARIIVPAAPDNLSKYPPNPLLRLITKDAKGNLLNTADNLSGTDYSGGLYDISKKQYTFNVARHLQALIDEKTENFGLFIQPPENATSSYRVRLNGGSNPFNNMKLEMIYQVLPN